MATLIIPNIDEASVILNSDPIQRNKMEETVTKLGIEFKPSRVVFSLSFTKP